MAAYIVETHPEYGDVLACGCDKPMHPIFGPYGYVRYAGGKHAGQVVKCHMSCIKRVE